MVDAPRLVSSDASPTRPEWAVTRSTPAARAAAWNRSPTIFGESGATRSVGPGVAAARRVRIARATSPFTNRRLALLVRLAPADGDQHPVAVGRVGDVGPAEGEDPGGAFPGRARLPGEAGPEARPGHRRRGACRGSPQVVELGEVGGEGRVLEPPAVEPGVEARSTPGGCSGRGPTRNFHRKNARAGG